MSSPATTCSMRSASRYTTCATRTTRAGMAARISDGRTPRAMTDWTSLRYAVADVEGNGQQPPDLVEVAVLPITDGALAEPVSWLARPPRPITRFAASVHRITDTHVADAPAFAEIEPDVRRALADRVLVAHNAHVDLGVLRRELRGWEPPKVFDTLKLARRLLPGQPSYKLGALVTALALDAGLPPGLA